MLMSFQPGDWVVCPWRGGKPSKVSVTYQGPYKVIKKLSNSTYQLQDPADLKRYEKAFDDKAFLEAFDDYVKDHPELKIKPQNQAAVTAAD